MTGPIAAGAMESERKPRPTSAMASSGRPAISPQSVSGLLAASAASTMTRSARRNAGIQRIEAARRPACCRGRSPSRTASGRSSRPRRSRRRGNSSSSWKSSDGTSIIAPSISLLGQAVAVAVQDGSARASISAARARTPPTSVDHREHEPELAPGRGLQQRADLRAQQRRPVERQAGSPASPSPGSPPSLRGSRAAPCRRRHRASGT